jgi:hypothetical protein
MIVTAAEILWSPDHDSHETLIKNHHLDDRTIAPDFVRVEIVPPGVDYTVPPDQWVYRVDQDYLPAWYSAPEAELACRRVLPAWYAAHVVTDGDQVVQDGQTRIALGHASQTITGGVGWAYNSVTQVVTGGEGWAYNSVTQVVTGGKGWAYNSVTQVVTGGVGRAYNSSVTQVVTGGEGRMVFVK